MRPFIKYKIYSKLNIFAETFPKLRLLKFKRTKWKRVQKILQLKKRSLIFKNNLNIFLKGKRISNLKRYYKESIFLKRALFAFYGNSLAHKFFQRLLRKNFESYKEYVLFSFLRPLFQIDVLLWKSGFFKTTFAVRQGLLTGQVLVNRQVVGLGYTVKAGDVISFNTFFDYVVTKSIIKTCSFIEVDTYLKQFIVLKNFSDLGKGELLLLFRELVDLKKFLNYLNYK